MAEQTAPHQHASHQSASQAADKFSEFCERLHAEGYVKGFAGGLNEEWHKSDHSLATLVGPVLSSAQTFMRDTFKEDRISVRYSCDSKHKCIGIAVLLPEELYLPKHAEIFDFLSALETVFSDLIPSLAGYFLDSRTITFSNSSPLDIRAVERDFPFAE